MNIGILVIGDELTSGVTLDTNSPFIARELQVQGWHVSSVITVGDDRDAISMGLNFLLGISDALIVTGGLGPTEDDITTVAVAGAFGLDIYTDTIVLNQLIKRFERRGIPWTENNAKQALFPEGASIIENPVGTASGFLLEKNGKPVAVIPGVPAEAQKMFSDRVNPLFRERLGYSGHIAKKTIKTFGRTESQIGYALSQEKLTIPGVSVGSYPRFPEIHLMVTSRGEDRDTVEENLGIICGRIERRLHKHIFGYDEETLEGVVAALLTDLSLTLSVAESCTGGLIVDRLTDVSGSSIFLERGVVAYSNTAKVELLEVPDLVIQKYGAVSKEVAILMAEGVKKRSGTDLGLATTGIAGPAGGTEGKPVGTVLIALSSGEDTLCRRFLFDWDRRRIKEISSHMALNMLRRFLVDRERLT